MGSDMERERDPRLFCTHEVNVEGPEHNRCTHPEQPHGGLCCWPCDKMDRIPSGRIDWKTRALAAEARIREAVEALIKPDGACWDAFDFSSARTRGLFVLTCDPVPEPVRKPEPLVVLEIPDARCWAADGNGACIYLGYWVDDNGTLHPACDFEGTAFKDNQVPPRVSHCPFGEGALRVTVEKVTP